VSLKVGELSDEKCIECGRFTPESHLDILDDNEPLICERCSIVYLLKKFVDKSEAQDVLVNITGDLDKAYEEELQKKKAHVDHKLTVFSIDGKNTKSSVSCLNQYLDQLAKNEKLCLNCGGIQPEIMLEHNGKQFSFVCTEIKEATSGKVLIATNYQEFYNYLSQKGYSIKAEGTKT
jgi:hypothetical protein